MAKKHILDMPVSFGRVGVGAGTALLPIKIAREDLDISEADNTLCGHRLTCRVLVMPKGEDLNQQRMPGMEDSRLEIVGVCDVKRIGVSPDEISCGLTFNKKDVDGDKLFDFANRTGRLVVTNVAEIPEEAKAAAADDESDEE
jgi:hypothetical protein